MKLLDLPDELLLKILSYHSQVKFDMFKNVRYLITLSSVCRKFYYVCHDINNKHFFLIYNYISLCNGTQLNKTHNLFTKNILTNWSNINIILLFEYSYQLTYFNIYEKELLKYKNIHLSFNIEKYVEDFIIFYNVKKHNYFENIKQMSKISINIFFCNELDFSIYQKLNKIKDTFIFRNVSFNNCRNVIISNTLKTEKLKIYNCKNCTLNLNCDYLKIVNIKNSRSINVNNINNIKLLNVKCAYNIIFQSLENINQIKIIESRVIFNEKMININYLFIKMINNFFIIPSHSTIFKIIYLYKYYINNNTIDIIKDKYNIESSNVSIVNLHRSTKHFLY